MRRIAHCEINSIIHTGIPSYMKQSKKIIELEALRGIAAIVVLLHHFMLGFTPRLHGLLYPDQPYSIFGTPLFAFVNGSAAVVVFFVLSGFVLTVGIFTSESSVRTLVAALKRWPRLALTVTGVNVIAGALMAHSLFENVHAATVVPSIWLGWFYNWQSIGTREIVDAAIEGATTFFTGSARYNSNLWTMYYEFWGSMIALGCAFVILAISNRYMQTLFLFTLWLITSVFSAYLGSFIVGVAIAASYVRRKEVEWPAWTAIVIVPAIIVLFGYHENLISNRAEGWYKILNSLTLQNPSLVRVLLHSVAATLVILLFLHVPKVKQAMNGRVGKTLGFMSFAIYLSQILVICSASSWAYDALRSAPHIIRIAVCLFVTISGTILLAIPFAFIDRWWVQRLSIFSSSKRPNKLTEAPSKT